MKSMVLIVSSLICMSSFGSLTKGNYAARHMQYEVQETVKYTAADYIQDGLVAMWDGIENVGWGEHDATASSIVDLVGGCGSLELNQAHLQVYNNAYIGDTFIGNSNYENSYFALLVGSHEAAETILSLAGNFTLDYCAETTEQSFYIWNSPLIRVTGSSNKGDVLGYQPAVKRIGGLGMFGNGMYNLTTGIHGTYTFIGSGSSVECFVDGISKGVNSVGASGAAGNLVIGVCKKLYNVRIYSRCLTPREIAYNNMIDKVRFGL